MPSPTVKVISEATYEIQNAVCLNEKLREKAFEIMCSGQNIGGISLRMRITLQQAMRTGLTQYTTILKMFKDHLGFPWGKIAAKRVEKLLQGRCFDRQ